VWLEEVLDEYYSDWYISLDRNFNVVYSANFPLVVVDFSPSVVNDVSFGRRVPFVGGSITYTFTLYLYSKINLTSGEDYNRDVQILTRRIIDWFTTKHQNQTEMTQHNIWSVIVVGGRESEPEIRDVSRIILTIEIEVLREDGQ
jgi:hypothetical protein